jgi:Fe-Mn family superoxide dismutase
MAFTTPDLPYAYDALEPYIDARTMELHHDKHHAGYTAKLNKALEGSSYAEKPIEELLAGLNELPEEIKTPVRNFGGGHYNHALFWRMMSPDGGGRPGGRLAENIETRFGGFDSFADEFAGTAKTHFGSGWAWLAVDGRGALTVLSSLNQDSPLSRGLTPILGLDMWEHAYYLKYQNRKAEYIDSFFEIINWPYVSELYEAALR